MACWRILQIQGCLTSLKFAFSFLPLVPNQLCTSATLVKVWSTLFMCGHFYSFKKELPWIPMSCLCSAYSYSQAKAMKTVSSSNKFKITFNVYKIILRFCQQQCWNLCSGLILNLYLETAFVKGFMRWQESDPPVLIQWITVMFPIAECGLNSVGKQQIEFIQWSSCFLKAAELPDKSSAWYGNIFYSEFPILWKFPILFFTVVAQK